MARTNRPAFTRLGIEALEDRSMMAVTAVLNSAGLLTITGDSGNNTIGLRQSGGKVTVDGAGKTFLSSSIKSVKIDGGLGDDSINLSGLKTGGQAFAKPITIVAGTTTDTVKGLDGLTTYIGAGGAMSITNLGAVTVGGKSVTWIDRSIKDTALRNVLRTGFTDGVLGRTDMLNAFKKVTSDKKMTTDEYNALKLVVANDSLFGNLDYVKNLARDVVLGNPANAKFQGTKLGNLTATSTTAQLDKLVGKWFLGADRPLAQYGGTTYAYANASGTLFGSGPQYTDVRQGLVGDCYFLASLSEIAVQSPSALTNMFIVNGDGTYTVKFFNNGQADYVTVDSKLPVDSSGRFVFANYGQLASSSSNKLWVALAEKAYAQMNEVGWLRQGLPGNAQNAYQSVAGGYMSHAVKQVANQTTITASTIGGSVNLIASLFNAGKLVGFASVGSPSNGQVVGNHQYIVSSVNVGAQTVTLFNPWGINNGTSMPGEITLTWNQIQTNFSYWDRT